MISAYVLYESFLVGLLNVFKVERIDPFHSCNRS